MKNSNSSEYEIVTSEIIPALVSGAGVGAVFMAAGMVVPQLIHLMTHFNFEGLLLGIPFQILYIGVVSFIIFCLGIFCLGGPIWMILHNLGFKGRTSAIVLGILLVFTVSFAILDNIQKSALMSIAGAAAGFQVWSVAYQRKEVTTKDTK